MTTKWRCAIKFLDKNDGDLKALVRVLVALIISMVRLGYITHKTLMRGVDHINGSGKVWRALDKQSKRLYQPLRG